MFAVISVDKYLHLKDNRTYNLVASAYSSEDKKISEKIKMACAKNEVWYYDGRKIKNWLSAVGELQLFSNLKTNSMYSDKDIWNNDANVEKNQTDKQKNNSLFGYTERSDGSALSTNAEWAESKPSAYFFAAKLAERFAAGESFNWVKAQKLAKELNYQASQQELMVLHNAQSKTSKT